VSYDTLQERTGLCRQSIAVGLARLERTGILKIVRRLVRQRVERVSPITGEAEAYVGTTQTSSLYSLHRPGAWADHLPVPRGRSAPFPCARQLTMLERMVATWKVSPSLKQSLHSRLQPTPSFTELANIIPGRREQKRCALAGRPSQSPFPPLLSATAAPDMGFSRKSWGGDRFRSAWR
jgi:hypothetical protein